MRNLMLITIRAYKSFKRMTSIRLLVQCHPFDVLTKLRWELQDFFKGSKGQGGGTFAHSRKHLKVEMMHQGHYNSMFMFYKHFRSKRTAIHGFKFFIFTFHEN